MRSGNRLHLLPQQRGLGPGAHVELAEDRRDVGLHRRLGNVQVVGDLLVQQPFADHGEYPELLRGEAGEPGAGGLGLLAEVGLDQGKLVLRGHL